MNDAASGYQISEIDPSVDELMTRFVTLENTIRTGRTRTVGERRSLMSANHGSVFLVASMNGTWVGVLVGWTHEIDRGRNVWIQAGVELGHELALVALVDRVAEWRAAASVEGIVAMLADPADTEVQRWMDMGFSSAGTHQGWRLRITDDLQMAAGSIPGVRIVSLTQHMHLEASAFAAWCDAYRAIPDELVTQAIPTHASWRAELIRDGGDSFPRSLLVAVDANDRVIGVGYLHIHKHPPGTAGHRFTGVVSDWRGRGVARLIKASQIEWAARNAITELRGNNNTQNHAMLHINKQLGYEPMTTTVTMRRPRAPA